MKDGKKNSEIKWYKKLAFVFFFISMPFVLLAACEVILRLSGVGYDTEPFVVDSRSPTKYYVSNDQYRKKFFSLKYVIEKSASENVFPIEKDKNTIRGFVIGESTAEGFPYFKNQSFSKMIEKALSIGDPSRKVEVLNLGFAAMGSFYTRETVEKVLKYSPDFIVVYGGHNEIYGTYGMASGGTYLSRRLNLWLKDFRVFQLLFGLFEAPDKRPDKTLMEAQFDKREILRDSPEIPSMIKDFTQNMRAVIETCRSCQHRFKSSGFHRRPSSAFC